MLWVCCGQPSSVVVMATGSEAITANIQLGSSVCEELETSPSVLGFVTFAGRQVVFLNQTASVVVPLSGFGEAAKEAASLRLSMETSAHP